MAQSEGLYSRPVGGEVNILGLHNSAVVFNEDGAAMFEGRVQTLDFRARRTLAGS
jgi:hypothetical protein